MTDSLRELLFGPIAGRRELVETIVPRRTFADVILPPATRQALEHALATIRHHDLIFREWGLGERHSTGLGLAFHFAGPPGTGKTICAEALAHALERPLLVARYSEIESTWAGQTARNVAEVFRLAAREDAVLLFDEADAIAARRFGAVTRGYEREANIVVNVLLHELDRHPGVVIFATNLASNLDPAFERRIRTHILFELPDVDARERIWRAQIHSGKTPLADDVDFRALAEKFERSGGDIKNAVLKAAQLATAEPGPDRGKRIHQRHFEQGMREVMAAQEVMAQSLFADGPEADPLAALGGVWQRLAAGQEELERELGRLEGRLAGIERVEQRLIEQVDGVRELVERRATPSPDTGPAARPWVYLVPFLVAAFGLTAAALLVALGTG
ncbi:MAG TPA: AAA family ATPase [Gemmatimonadales bacterium]|nr:AAA family ATPase [Gemmatimonadales bacterium]